MRTSLKLTFAALALVAAGTLAGCSNSSSDASAKKTTTITIATDGATKPFDYSDSQGKLTGYDIEVARAVFKKLPQYKAKFQVTDFSGITPGIDSGRYQMGANDFGWNETRAKSYDFSYPLSKSNNAVLVKSGSYKNLGDLAGKSTIGNPASNYTKSIQDWNKANPDKQIKLSYSADSTSINTRFEQVESGKIDFMLYDKISLKSAIKDTGFEDLKVEDINMDAGDPEHDGYEYFLFAKDEQGQKLQKQVNKALAELQADGTLSKISKKYLGGDFVPKSEMFK